MDTKKSGNFDEKVPLKWHNPVPQSTGVTPPPGLRYSYKEFVLVVDLYLITSNSHLKVLWRSGVIFSLGSQVDWVLALVGRHHLSVMTRGREID